MVALPHAQRGLALLLQWGTAWDKRLSWDAWVAWCRVLLQSARCETAWPQKPFGMLNVGLVADLGPR